MVYLNCQRNSICERLFQDLDVQRIVKELERHFDTDIVAGQTLLLFDEVQEAKNAITSLKYFCEELKSLHVVVAGSLLGLQLREDKSFLVGKVHTINMYPMTFNEYLLACGRYGQAQQEPNSADLSGAEFYGVAFISEILHSTILDGKRSIVCVGEFLLTV